MDLNGPDAMIKSLKRDAGINAGFGMALVILIVIGSLFNLNVMTVTELGQMEERSHAVILELERLLSAMKDVENGEHIFIITGEDKNLGPYHAAFEQIDRSLATLKSLTRDHYTAQQDRLYRVEPLIRERLTEAGKTIAARKSEGFQAGYRRESTYRHKHLTDEIRGQLVAAREAVGQELNRKKALKKLSTRNTLLAVFAGIILSSSLLISTFLLLKWDIARRKRAEEALLFSESRYRTLFRDNPAMIVTLDAELTMLSVNPVCACQLGYLIEELEGQSVLQLFHAEDQPIVSEQLHNCLQTPGQVYRGQFRKIRKDGGLLWVEETAQAVHDLNGSLDILVVCQDITERRQIADELEKANMQNELILASAGEGIIGLDLEGNHTFINAAAAAMLGYDVKELAGKQSHSTWHYARPDGSRYPAEECPVYAAYKDGVVHSGEETYWRKDGTGFPVEYISRPMFSATGIVGAVLTFYDITSRKQMDEALRKSEERFRATFNQVAVGIGHVAPDGRWLRINQKFCDIVGYTEEEISALTIQEITHPDDRETSMKHYRLLLEGKLSNYSLEKRYIRKDGSTVWVNLTA